MQVIIQCNICYLTGFKEKLATSFSIYKNIPDLLSFDRSEGEITCIHGIRVLSMALIILGNSFLYTSLSLTGAPVTGNILLVCHLVFSITYKHDSVVLSFIFCIAFCMIVLFCIISRWQLILEYSLERCN